MCKYTTLTLKTILSLSLFTLVLSCASSNSGEAGVLELNTALHDFGEVVIGETAETEIIITNVGKGGAFIISIGLNGLGDTTSTHALIYDDFYIENIVDCSCEPEKIIEQSDESYIALKRDGKLSIKIKFKPSALNMASASLIITNISLSNNPLIVELIANTQPQEINVTPNPYNFGKVDLNETQKHTFTIENKKSTSLYINDIFLDSGDINDFEIDLTNFVNTLQPAETTTFDIIFTPTYIKQSMAKIAIILGEFSSLIYAVTISGTGIEPQMIVLNEQSEYVENGSGEYNFLLSPTGTANQAKFTIKNVGSNQLKLTGNEIIEISGENSNAFNVTVNPDTEIEAGNETNFTIEFTPATVSNFSAIISIENTDVNDNPYTFKVIGEGIFKASIYVCDSTGDDITGDGSFLKPYKTIQKGLNEASTGQVIQVFDGTYKGGDSSNASRNRDLNFSETGDKDVYLRGNPDNPEKVVIDCEGTSTSLHRGFIFNSGETDSSVVNGFSIINGYTTGSWPDNAGAGIYCNGSSPSIESCFFSNNTISGSVARGSAISCINSSMSIKHCEIRNNIAGYDGGGISVFSSTNVIISNTIIEDNSFNGHGAIYNGGSSIYTSITNCIIRRNTAQTQGCSGIYFSTGSKNIKLQDCIIVNNKSSDRSGGIDINGDSDISISNCKINNNIASLYGGGVYSANGSKLKFTNCEISGNSAFDGGGIFIENACEADLEDCLIANNSASQDDGGGITVNGSKVTIVNSTIVNNTAFNKGGGVFFQNSPTGSLSDTIIWGNVSQSNDGHQIKANSGSIEITYCDIADNSISTDNIEDDSNGINANKNPKGFVAGEYGNISNDPRFVQGPCGFYYLEHAGIGGGSTNSLCINAGSDNISAFSYLTGRTTAFDGSEDTGNVDIGYHYVKKSFQISYLDNLPFTYYSYGGDMTTSVFYYEPDNSLLFFGGYVNGVLSDKIKKYTLNNKTVTDIATYNSINSTMVHWVSSKNLFFIISDSSIMTFDPTTNTLNPNYATLTITYQSSIYISTTNNIILFGRDSGISIMHMSIYDLSAGTITPQYIGDLHTVSTGSGGGNGLAYSPIQEIIYWITGGWSTRSYDTLWGYNVATKQNNIVLAKAPTAQRRSCAAIYNPSDDAFYTASETNFWRYDCNTNTWITIPGFPYNLPIDSNIYVQVAINQSKDEIYYIGGKNHSEITVLKINN